VIKTKAGEIGVTEITCFLEEYMDEQNVWAVVG